ncbi:LysR substrate-binding domain-containing protein [Uliginosibacterium sp. H1]|uniref:LysR substrate-binding domain-containing protein n=1 Tax=Uliginosibacterium sp. H1 TaxID=3114757 RepID=UPI002E16E656|nr:LysR substrate-binding domain-containing protein [Uliginosibacterium sp. H1]
MLPTLDLELLRSFVAAADEGSFTSAGERVGLTQSAVTQQMQRLEAQVGVALFQREGRTKQLTDHGRQLLRYAREMLSLNDDAMRSLSDSALVGSLRIGAPHDIADTLLPPLLSHIARSSPNLKLEINVARSPHLMEALHRGELDMTISTREDPRLHGIVLRTLPTLWICASQFVHVPQQPLPLVLIDEPSIFRRLALEALDAQRVPWRLAYSSSSLIGIKAAIRAGLGVTARTLEMLTPDLRTLGPNEGLPPLPDVTYYLWIRKSTVNPLVRQAFDLIASRLVANG